MQRAVIIYNIPKSILRTRRASTLLQHNCEPKLKKLTKPKKSAIVQHILDLDL
jgi:hypothetical protein